MDGGEGFADLHVTGLEEEVGVCAVAFCAEDEEVVVGSGVAEGGGHYGFGGVVGRSWRRGGFVVGVIEGVIGLEAVEADDLIWEEGDDSAVGAEGGAEVVVCSGDGL